MTHPITPPPWELVEKWMAEIWHEGTPVQISASDVHIAARAAQWGADQELEACCKVLEVSDRNAREFLYTARRPKPPSLKEQALSDLNTAYNEDAIDDTTYCNIRRALEALPND